MGRCEDVKAFYGSDDHKRMDLVRSGVDAEGNPVQTIDSFGDIPVITMDLCTNDAEARMFERIEDLTTVASAAGHRDYSWIDDELDRFIKIAQKVEVPRQLVATH